MPRRSCGGTACGRRYRRWRRDRHQGIEIQINAFVGGGLHFDVHVSNHGLAAADLLLGWDLDADFADQGEARLGERQQQAPVERHWHSSEHGGTLFFRCRHEQLAHATTLRLSGADEAFDSPGGILSGVSLQPGASRSMTLDIVPCFQGKPVEPLYGLDGAPVREPRLDLARGEWIAGCATLSGGITVERCWAQAASDLGSLLLLEGNATERFMEAAGMPGYSGMFGRDGLVTGLQSALLTPATLRGTLEKLSEWNATRTDDRHDAQPGKVLHQRQLGPLALLGNTPFIHYYGDHSASMLFLLGAAAEFAWTNDAAFLRSPASLWRGGLQK